MIFFSIGARVGEENTVDSGARRIPLIVKVLQWPWKALLRPVLRFPFDVNRTKIDIYSAGGCP